LRNILVFNLQSIWTNSNEFLQQDKKRFSPFNNYNLNSFVTEKVKPGEPGGTKQPVQ
jgi:hypothetical protein